MLKTSLYLIVIFLVGLFIFKFTNNNSANNRITLQNWAKNKILSETAYFQSHHFSKKDVDKTYNDLSAINDNMLIRFQIVDGKVSSNATDTSNPHIIKASNSFHKFFDHLVKQYPLDQNVYFIISISDTLSIPDNYTPTAPIIVPSKYTNSPYAQFLLLAPHYKTVSEWPKIYDDILATNPHYPWEHKVEKAFWRGGFTTSSLTRSN